MKRLRILISVLSIVSFFSACATPTPEIVEKIVEKEVTRQVEKVVTQVVKETIKETVVVEGTPQVVEKEVTKIVEVEKVVTPTPEPTVDAASMTPVEGGTLTMALDTSPGGYFNPGLAPSSYTSFVGNLIWPQLFRWNEDGSGLEGNLVERWEQSDDFTKMTFYLQENAVWHDGTPITADDVAFTIWALSHPDIESNRGGVIQWIAGLQDSKHPPGADNVEGIKVIDEKTVEFTFQIPMSEINIIEPLGIWMSIIPKHIMENVPPEEFNDAEFWRNPTVGGGPFKFVDFKEDEYVELERFDDFYLGRPYIERIIIKIVNPTTIVAQLEKGEIDMTTGITTVRLDDWERVKALPNVNAYTTGIGTGIRLQFNCSEERPLGDKRVRQAIGYAANRQLVVDKVLDGLGYVTNNFRMHPHNPFYNSAVDDMYPYNPDKARELLAEANWDANTEIDLLVPTGDPMRELAGDIVMANLVDAGIKVNYRKMEYRTELSVVRKEKDYDIAMIRTGGDLDPQMSYFEGNYSNGPYNYAYQSFPDLDVLFDKLARTLDFETRQEIIHEIQVEMNDVMPHLVLYYPYALNAANTRVHNVNYLTGYLAVLRNAHEWWIEPNP